MDELWTYETQLWLQGATAFAALLHPACVMVFPEPVGILQGPAILESLVGVPRWQTVNMQDQASGGADTVVLAYRAEGQREGAAPYHAYCSSTYIRTPDGWRIIQHHQTPL
ncbi:MAG: nuclear transport factor 2 family protein [Paracoccaceae bacterium]